MSRVVKFNVVLSSKSEGKIHPNEYFIDDEQVDKFEYYGVSHLKKSSAKVLRKALADTMKQEPFGKGNITPYEWRSKVGLIEELLREKLDLPRWVDLSDY